MVMATPMPNLDPKPGIAPHLTAARSSLLQIPHKSLSEPNRLDKVFVSSIRGGYRLDEHGSLAYRNHTIVKVRPVRSPVRYQC